MSASYDTTLRNCAGVSKGSLAMSMLIHRVVRVVRARQRSRLPHTTIPNLQQWTRTVLAAAIGTIALQGCSVSPVSTAICDASAPDRKDLAGALVEDGGPKSKVAGVRLLTRMETACR